MSSFKPEIKIRHTLIGHGHGNGKGPIGDDLANDMKILSSLEEGRSLIKAAANMDLPDLKALADFATSASRGSW